MPMPNINQSAEGSRSAVAILDDFLEGPIFSSIFSIGLLTVLIRYREPLTPDFLHFTTCLPEEEAHFIWIMFLWLCYKCWLTLDTNQTTLLNEKQVRDEKLKAIVKGAIELTIALFTMTWSLKHFGPWVYCPVMYGLAALRTLFEGQLDLTGIIFVIAYSIQNLIVNLVDFAFFQKKGGFYTQDDVFVQMFSHKIFQALTCLMIAFVYAQCIKPTSRITEECPGVLRAIFNLTIPCNMVMLLAFLYELTLFDQRTRQQIFKGELTKLFFNVISFYFVAILYAHWVQGLIYFS